MNYFTSKIDTIRDQTITMQLSAPVSHQIVHYRSPDGTHSSIDETLMQRHISTKLMKKQTHPDLGWAEGWAHSQHIFLFGWTINFNMENFFLVWTLWPVLTIFSVQYKLNIIDSICDMLLITKNRNKQK